MHAQNKLFAAFSLPAEQKHHVRTDRPTNQWTNEPTVRPMDQRTDTPFYKVVAKKFHILTGLRKAQFLVHSHDDIPIIESLEKVQKKIAGAQEPCKSRVRQ